MAKNTAAALAETVAKGDHSETVDAALLEALRALDGGAASDDQRRRILGATETELLAAASSGDVRILRAVATAEQTIRATGQA